MKRLLSIAFASIVFFAGLLLQSCSKVNQSVFKPLTTEEIAKIEKKYPGFATAYDAIRSADSSFFTERDRVKFVELTYRDICEYEKYKKDNRDRFYQEHDSLYSPNIHKGDSVLAYWKDYVDKINSSVDIRLKRIRVDYFFEYYLIFEATPKVDGIELFTFEYRHGKKSNDSKGDWNECFWWTPLNGKDEAQFSASWTDIYDISGYKNADELLEKEFFETRIRSYRSNGTTYSIFYVPVKVKLYNKSYNEDGKSGFENDWYEDIIEDADTSYMSRNTYTLEKFREFDSLSYDFMNYVAGAAIVKETLNLLK